MTLGTITLGGWAGGSCLTDITAMTLTNHRLWFADLDGKSTELNTLAELRDHVAHLASRATGELSVCADVGPRPWWHRLFGAIRYVSIYFILAWRGDTATLTFPAEDGSEHVAANIPKDRAFEAVRAFLEAGERPAWLDYSRKP